MNAKRIYRLYMEERLTVRTKMEVKTARRQRVPADMLTSDWTILPYIFPLIGVSVKSGEGQLV